MDRLILSTTGLVADLAARTLRGLMLPLGEDGHTNVGRVRVDSLAGLMLAEQVTGYVDHTGATPQHPGKRQPVAQLVASEATEQGLFGTFHVNDELAGDVLLAEAARGERTGLSVEIPDPVIRQGRLLGGTIDGVAFVPKPAFASARLVASDAGHLTAAQASDVAGALQAALDAAFPDAFPYLVDFDPDQATVTYDDGSGQLYQDGYSSDDAEPPTITLNGSPSQVRAVTTYAPVASAPDDTTTSEAPVETETLAASANDTPPPAARAPQGIPGRRPSTPPPADKRTLRDIIRAQVDAARRAGGDRQALVAALADVTYTAVGADVTAPQWIGELWDGVTYVRRYVPLLTQAELTRLKITGWHWTTKPAMASYAGDKAAITSNAVGTDPDAKTASRWAGGHDIDRAMVDFENTDWWQSYYAAMSESYSRLTDAAAFAAIVAGATDLDMTGTTFDPDTGVSLGATALVDGALLVAETALPTFAIMAPDLYRGFLLTPRDKILELLNASLGITEGSALGFQVVPGPSTMTAGHVIVGAKAAATHYELGGGAPIRVDAINIANGGVDAGVYGYSATMINDADGLVDVDATSYDAPV